MFEDSEVREHIYVLYGCDDMQRRARRSSLLHDDCGDRVGRDCGTYDALFPRVFRTSLRLFRRLREEAVSERFDALSGCENTCALCADAWDRFAVIYAPRDPLPLAPPPAVRTKRIT